MHGIRWGYAWHMHGGRWVMYAWHNVGQSLRWVHAGHPACQMSPLESASPARRSSVLLANRVHETHCPTIMGTVSVVCQIPTKHDSGHVSSRADFLPPVLDPQPGPEASAPTSVPCFRDWGATDSVISSLMCDGMLNVCRAAAAAGATRVVVLSAGPPSDDAGVRLHRYQTIASRAREAAVQQLLRLQLDAGAQLLDVGAGGKPGAREEKLLHRDAAEPGAERKLPGRAAVTSATAAPDSTHEASHNTPLMLITAAGLRGKKPGGSSVVVATGGSLASAPAVTVLEASMFFKDADRMFRSIGKSGKQMMVGSAAFGVRCNPISGADLAARICDSLDRPEEANRRIRVGGPQLMTFMVRIHACSHASMHACGCGMLGRDLWRIIRDVLGSSWIPHPRLYADIC